MKILAKIKADSSKEEKSEITYMTIEEFRKQFYVKNGKRTYCTQQDAVWWSGCGRIGSRWQVGKDMYIMLEKEGDDPYEYYKPEIRKSSLSGTGGTWYKDCCGSGSCGSGSCGSGCSC